VAPSGLGAEQARSLVAWRLAAPGRVVATSVSAGTRSRCRVSSRRSIVPSPFRHLAIVGRLGAPEAGHGEHGRGSDLTREGVVGLPPLLGGPDRGVHLTTQPSLGPLGGVVDLIAVRSAQNEDVHVVGGGAGGSGS